MSGHTDGANTADQLRDLIRENQRLIAELRRRDEALAAVRELAEELKALAAAKNRAASDLRGQERPGAALGEQSAATAYDRSAAALCGRLHRFLAADEPGRSHTPECYERGCTTGAHPAPRPGHRTGGPWTPEGALAAHTEQATEAGA